MRYGTFRLLRALVIIGIITGVFMLYVSSITPTYEKSTPSNSSISNTYTPPPSTSASAPVSVTAKVGDKSLPLSAVDNKVLELQKTEVTKVEDKSGKNYKNYKKLPTFIVDMRCDFTKGFSTWNRIKVDLDKDKNYDEKWTFRNNGDIIKEISSSDDETYNYEYKLSDNTWELQ